MSEPSAQAQFEAFLSRYAPEMIAHATAAVERMRRLVPGAIEMVYDNYNALVVGFSASERPSEAVLSLAFMPRWVTLCFLHGTGLSDPHGLLRGGGNQVRNVRLSAPEDLDRPEIRALIDQAVAASVVPFDPTRTNRMVIRSISAKQRPRRPAGGSR